MGDQKVSSDAHFSGENGADAVEESLAGALSLTFVSGISQRFRIGTLGNDSVDLVFVQQVDKLFVCRHFI
jgi:hypothetical protein